MRLFPVLVAVVAIAVPLSECKNANGQTADTGQVFNRNTLQKDLQRVYGLGLFEDVNVSLDPSTDPSKVDVVVNVAERSGGSVAVGGGISSASGLFGTVSYQQQNLNGKNQKLGAEVQVGQRDLLFDLRFTDPWIAGDPYRTSYTTNLFRRSSISLIFDGKNNDIKTFETGKTNGDRPRVLRLGGALFFDIGSDLGSSTRSAEVLNKNGTGYGYGLGIGERF